MRGAANSIAQIAFIEFPRGEWLEVLDSITENTDH
jgi:hypothetical protein